jgi:surface antigen
MNKLTVVALSFTVLLTGCVPVTNEGVGTISGGVIGGLLGSQFGGGSGKVMAAAGGALVGAYLGGQIGKSMDKVDRMEMEKALETAPTGKAVRWSNPDTGNRYTVKPVRTYYQAQQACREYITQAVIAGKNEQIHGKACRRADGSWHVVN